jgi:DNA-binding LytR/AlgR family response regulator
MNPKTEPKLKKPDMRIRVSIVEDNRGTRESLTELLTRAPALRFVNAHPGRGGAAKDSHRRP